MRGEGWQGEAEAVTRRLAVGGTAPGSMAGSDLPGVLGRVGRRRACSCTAYVQRPLGAAATTKGVPAAVPCSVITSAVEPVA